MKYRTKLWLTALIGGILSLVCFLYSVKSREVLTTLERPGSGEGDQKQQLLVEFQEKSSPFSFLLKEVPYGEEASGALLAEAGEGMEAVFLKENEDCGHIRSRVDMPSVYPDTDISVEWYLSSWEYIDPDGTVKNTVLKEEVQVQVQAVLSLEGQSLTWEREIRVCPPVDPTREQKLEMLEEELLRAQEEPGESVRLPQTFLGEPVVWYRKADDRWRWMLGLTLLTVAALVLGKRQETDREQKKRERSMQLDYPDIVSRLSLYMGAGISTRNAWERLVDQYEKRLETKGECRPAYEEMRRTLYEMQSGVSESLAYERFGTRCRMQAYLKLGTLLSQNLRKGTKNLAGLLLEESREAFENRKALAKRLGEECESRLLLPMFLMLLTILIIIMYPAAVSFSA